MKDIDIRNLREYDPITNKYRCMVCNKEYCYPSGCYKHIINEHKKEVIKSEELRCKVPSNIKARIAVAIGKNGNWCAYGDSAVDESDVKKWAVDSIDSCADFMWIETVINPTLTAVEKVMLKTQGTTDVIQSICDRTNMTFEKVKDVVEKYMDDNKIDPPRVKNKKHLRQANPF